MRSAVIYSVFGPDGAPLYVGLTTQLRTRQRAHHAAQPAWFGNAARIEIDGPFPEPIARAVERQRIAKLQPRFNVRQKERSKYATLRLRIEPHIHAEVCAIAQQRGLSWRDLIRLWIHDEANSARQIAA